MSEPDVFSREVELPEPEKLAGRSLSLDQRAFPLRAVVAALRERLMFAESYGPHALKTHPLSAFFSVRNEGERIIAGELFRALRETHEIPLEDVRHIRLIPLFRSMRTGLGTERIEIEFLNTDKMVIRNGHHFRIAFDVQGGPIEGCDTVLEISRARGATHLYEINLCFPDQPRVACKLYRAPTHIPTQNDHPENLSGETAIDSLGLRQPPLYEEFSIGIAVPLIDPALFARYQAAEDAPPFSYVRAAGLPRRAEPYLHTPTAFIRVDKLDYAT